MNPENQAHSPHPVGIRPDPGKKSRSEAAGAANPNTPDPQHPPRKRRRPSLLIVMALLLIGVGQAAWPVIDISAVAQLVETVRLATDTLAEMTTAKDALLGQVAVLTGTWDDLTGEAYELGENASSLVTDYSLTGIDTRLADLQTDEENSWPTNADIEDAYSGADSSVVDQVLEEHQAALANREAARSPWYNSHIVIAEAGNFLSRIETTASTQNSETTQGLGAQLDRQIAVSSSLRDIAAKQLEVSLTTQQREFLLNRQRALIDGQLRQHALRMRAETQDTLADYGADFDAEAFDESLYRSVITSP